MTPAELAKELRAEAEDASGALWIEKLLLEAADMLDQIPELEEACNAETDALQLLESALGVPVEWPHERTRAYARKLVDRIPLLEKVLEAAQALTDANAEKLRHGRASRQEVQLEYAIRAATEKT